MNIQVSIIAGQILSLLEEKKRAVSFGELKYYLEESTCFIQAGVERLIKEGLAVLDVEQQEIKVVAMPKFNSKKIEANQSFYKKMSGV